MVVATMMKEVSGSQNTEGETPVEFAALQGMVTFSRWMELAQDNLSSLPPFFWGLPIGPEQTNKVRGHSSSTNVASIGLTSGEESRMTEEERGSLS